MAIDHIFVPSQILCSQVIKEVKKRVIKEGIDDRKKTDVI